MSKVNNYIHDDSIKDDDFKTLIEFEGAKLDIAVKIASMRKELGLSQQNEYGR